MTLAEVVHRFDAKPSGAGYRARCPVHTDDTPSLSITKHGDKILINCQAGCATEDILRAKNLTMKDLFVSSNGRHASPIIATYDYRDPTGTLCYRKHKTPDKVFWFEHPDGRGGWTKGVQGLERHVYRRNEIVGQTELFITEGEKDADRIWSLGLPATTNDIGAGKWTDALTAQLTGVTDVWVLEDNDEAGRNHAADVAARCARAGMRARIVRLPGLAEHGDVSDWLDAGHTLADLMALAAAATLYAPEPGADASTESPRLDPAALSDATVVAAEGRALAEQGVQYLVDGVIPAYGMLGMLVAFAKVGKTTLGQVLGAAVANGVPFVGRTTTKTRVLVIAAEDPPEYTAYVARHLATTPGSMTFYRASVILNHAGLASIAAEIREGQYGLVLISSWQSVIRGLVKDENDNAGAVLVVEHVKAAARQTKVPWLIDAHSGKGEDQSDDADPSRAMRGASAAAGAADYTLWLRYADGAFGNLRRLSGKGRFVSLEPQTIAYNKETGEFRCLGATKEAAHEATWDAIQKTGALTAEPRTATAIATVAGLVSANGTVAGSGRRKVQEALRGRDGVVATTAKIRGQVTTLYCLGGAVVQQDFGGM